jgi:hypothetical protein
MQYVGPLALALTIPLLVALSVATGERGYCRMIHLVAKPLGLGAIAIWLLWWGRRGDFATWTLRQKLAWTGSFIAVFLFHALWCDDRGAIALQSTRMRRGSRPGGMAALPRSALARILSGARRTAPRAQALPAARRIACRA